MTRSICLGLMFMWSAAFGAMADAPNVQTPAPVIYLADNLDEADKLGWCIDTQGRGFGEYLHAHSCKPQGGDVQFGFEADTGLIRSVAFPDYCMAYDPGGASPLGLVTCDAGAGPQSFRFEATTGAITLKDDASVCLTVGDASRAAGPFMSRALDMVACAGTPAALKSWQVRP